MSSAAIVIGALRVRVMAVLLMDALPWLNLPMGSEEERVCANGAMYQMIARDFAPFHCAQTANCRIRCDKSVQTINTSLPVTIK